MFCSVFRDKHIRVYTFCAADSEMSTSEFTRSASAHFGNSRQTPEIRTSEFTRSAQKLTRSAQHSETHNGMPFPGLHVLRRLTAPAP